MTVDMQIKLVKINHDHLIDEIRLVASHPRTLTNFAKKEETYIQASRNKYLFLFEKKETDGRKQISFLRQKIV